ncbi:MAG: hypothetical protein QOH72_4595 [Solirubrobacteraceae bacterium]|jgi:hypothetical protein|nr:hypothetical protein [Solirubrobacteraceae bacterium]
MSDEPPTANTRHLPLRPLAIPPAPAPPISPQLARHGAEAASSHDRSARMDAVGQARDGG